MELRHLKYFVAVAETLSFRYASERLHVAQPAISRQIKDLEESIGARLFDRNTGGTKLTEAGAVLLEEAREILERVEMAAELTQNAAAGRRGHLHIAGMGSLSVGLMSDALAKFRLEYPKVQVSLHDLGYRDLLTELQAGTVHMGFSFEMQDHHLGDEFETEIVAESYVHVAISQRHPLAQRKSVSLRDLDSEDILCVGESDVRDLHRRVTQRLFSNRKIRHAPIKWVVTPDLLMTMVSGNYGISMVFPNFFRYPNVVLLPLNESGDDLKIRLSAIWRKKTQARLVRNFVDLLKEANGA